MPAYYGPFVVPEFLADSDDYVAYAGTAPANVNALLRAATSMVLDATNQGYYDVDTSTGLATDGQVGAALTRATVIQAAALSALGYDPLTGGVPQASVVQSTKAGGTSDTFADAAAAANARVAAVRDLVPDAVRILRLNNLLIPGVWVFG